MNGCAAIQIQGRNRIILGRIGVGNERLALGEQARRGTDHCREIQHPQCEIDEMDAEINHASAPRQHWIVEPRLVGPVGVVKGELHRKDVS